MGRNLKVEGTINVKGTITARTINAEEGGNLAEWFHFEGQKPRFADLVKLKRKGNRSFVILDTSGKGTLRVITVQKSTLVIVINPNRKEFGVWTRNGTLVAWQSQFVTATILG